MARRRKALSRSPIFRSPIFTEGDANQVARGSRAELFHNSFAMNFDGAKANSKLATGLLVGGAGHELRQYFLLARGERLPAWKMEFPAFGGTARYTLAFGGDGLLDTGNHLGAAERLFDEIERAVLLASTAMAISPLPEIMKTGAG